MLPLLGGGKEGKGGGSVKKGAFYWGCIYLKLIQNYMGYSIFFYLGYEVYLYYAALNL